MFQDRIWKQKAYWLYKRDLPVRVAWGERQGVA